MYRLRTKPPALLVVTGPTASGKTALAVALAERLDGEIINADSRQFYRGMDIGTAKPTADELARVPHHMLDVLDPDGPCSLAWFLDAAHAAILDIRTRGRLAVLAGGTAQYVRALVEGWNVPRAEPDPALRAVLAARAAIEGGQALHAELEQADPDRAAQIDPRNVRRVIRALEVVAARQRAPLPLPAPRADLGRIAALAIRWPRAALYARIDARVEAMFAAGFVEEVRRLNAAGYSCALPSFSAIGYREVCGHLRGELTIDEAITRTQLATHRLARSQDTWFRAFPLPIHWLDAGPALPERALAVVQATLPED